MYDQVSAELGNLSPSVEKAFDMSTSLNASVKSDISDFFTPAQSPQTSIAVISQTKDILLTTHQMTKGVLSTVTDSKWWHNTIQTLVKKVPTPGSRYSENDDREIESMNKTFDAQGCHPFYAEVIENSISDKVIFSCSSSLK